MIHRIAGVVLAIIFTMIYTDKVDWFSKFNETITVVLSQNIPVYYYGVGWGAGKESVVYLYIPAIISIFFLIFPSSSTKLFSPIDKNGKPILPNSFWCIPGYFMAVVAWGLLYIFE